MAALFVIEGAVITMSMTNSNATRNHVALMEESHHDASLLTIYEPGSVEEIQHIMDKCFGSSHAGCMQKCKD
jgi:hypothetical protein